MAPKTSSLLLIVAGIGIFISGAQAGAGALVQACYYTATVPTTPFTVFWTAGGSSDKCLNAVGHNNQMTVSTAGVTCADVGYVEGKDTSTGTDNCAVSDSVWTLSYRTDMSGDSGSTRSIWKSAWLVDNKLVLTGQTAGTVVCSAPALCTGDTFRWPHTLGPAYFIFNPKGTA